MQAKTKELLYLLLWTGEMLYRPTFRNVTESFEGWAYRKGLLRQLERLERQQLLEQTVTASGDRLHRLTAMGRLQALGGRDPEACGKSAGTVVGAWSCSTCPRPGVPRAIDCAV